MLVEKLQEVLVSIPPTTPIRIKENIEILDSRGDTIATETYLHRIANDGEIVFRDGVLYISFTNYWSQSKLDHIITNKEAEC